MATTDKNDKPDGKGAVITLLLAYVTSPFIWMFSAKIMEAVWGRLLAAQYGDGPTLRSWFGIEMLLTLALLTLKKDKSYVFDKHRPISTWIAGVILSMVVQLFALLVVVITQAMWGWS